MITRHSSRKNPLDSSFLNQKLQNAQAYDRIAGYFRSSIFEVAGEALSSVSGCIRVICNSDLDPLDVSTAKAAQQAMRKSWCAGQPELLPEANRERFRQLYEYLSSGKLQVRVLPDATFGLVHGKAGVITLADGSKTSFLGSMNESLTAWKLNYELLWEDNASDAVAWVQHEFDTLWNHHHAVPLSDFIIADIKRIAERETVSTSQWQKNPAPEQAIVETPVYRKELGLWPHQKFFVQRAFADHQQGGARYVLADQVGLGKTVQLALAGMLMAMTGTKPVLVLAPKPLLLQWQDELMELLEMPSAIWTGKNWIDEQGMVWPATGVESINKCPRKLGIISQGLITSGSNAADLLLRLQYECVLYEFRLLQQCLNALESDRENDPKYQNVVAYLFTKGWLELGCIIFSQYYDSVWWLANQLSEHHIPDEQIAIYAGSNRSGLLRNGQFKRLPRDEIKRRVRMGELRLVLGTDAASEGLNLQRLGTLINLDLPWNPTRLEQRKGRIQRIGQIRDEVLLYNMRYRDSVEDRVHELLSERLEDIFELFGQVPDILEDAWVDIALGDKQEAQRKIRSIPKRHPFDERYSQVTNIDWDSCSQVLDAEERRKMLRSDW
jgi:superfamily II DNA or RNA helicase